MREKCGDRWATYSKAGVKTAALRQPATCDATCLSLCLAVAFRWMLRVMESFWLDLPVPWALWQESIKKIEIHVSSLVTKIYFYWPLCLVWLASNNPHRTIIVFLQVFPKAGFSGTSSWSVFEIWTAFVHGRSPVMPREPAPCVLRQVSSFTWQHTESLTWLSPWLRNVPLVTEGTGKGQHAQMTTHDNHSFVHGFPKKLKSFGFRVMELSVGWKPVYFSGDSVPNEF